MSLREYEIKTRVFCLDVQLTDGIILYEQIAPLPERRPVAQLRIRAADRWACAGGNYFDSTFHCYASAMLRRLRKRCVYQRPLLVGRTERLQQQLRLRARDLVTRDVAGRSHHGSPIQGGRLRIFRL